MLRRSVARCLQPLIRNSAPPTLTGSAQNAGECARALWQGIGGSASQTAWRSSATGPASDAPAQAPTTQLTQHATHWLAPSPRWQLAWQASAGWQQTRRWSSRAPAGRSAPGPVDAPKPVSSAPSPGASADVQPDAKPGASTPAPGLATRQVAASAGTAVTKPLAAAEDSQRPVKAPSQAAEGLIPALRDVYDIGTWERVLDQHSDRITPQNAVPAWLQCASFARKATPDVHTAISLMSAIVSLQPHVCTHLQDAASTQEAACVYTGLHAIDATVAKGFSRRKGQGESTGTVSVGVSVPGHVHTQYRPMVQQLAVLCESKLAEVGVEQLTLDVAKPLSQRLFVPGYTQVAPALVYFVSNHRYYTVRDKHRVCKAVLTAMGQDIQVTNPNRYRTLCRMNALLGMAQHCSEFAPCSFAIRMQCSYLSARRCTSEGSLTSSCMLCCPCMRYDMARHVFVCCFAMPVCRLMLLGWCSRPSGSLLTMVQAQRDHACCWTYSGSWAA